MNISSTTSGNTNVHLYFDSVFMMRTGAGCFKYKRMNVCVYVCVTRV